MCKVTERARNFVFYLFGGDLDFPERYQLYIHKNIQPYFDSLEVDEEDIEYLLWERGDIALSARESFAIFNEENSELLLFSIKANNNYEGYFISLISCSKCSKSFIPEKNYPVIKTS